MDISADDLLYVTCRRCGGWGSIETSQSEDGRFSYQDQCPECSSHGVVPASPADILAAVRTLPGVVDISADDLLYEAWTVIANAGWDGADKSEGWQEAAVRWRDRWHAYLDETTDVLDEGGRLERVVLCEHGFDESHRVFTDARGMERCAKGSRTVVWPPKEDE